MLNFFLEISSRKGRKFIIIVFQITKEDALPKNICQRCVYKLDMFYEFRVSCMTTETVLKSYADSIKHLAAVVNSQVSNFFQLVFFKANFSYQF